MRIPFVGKYRTLNTVKVSAEALRHNLGVYRGLMPGKAICPVLKSNAYGHGLVEVAQVLDSERPEFFVVDSLHEAYLLKKAGIKARLLVLGYTFPENLTRKKLPFHFAVSDLQSAEVLAKQGAKVHLKIDTGMNRMGFSMEELPEALDRLKELKVEVVGVLSHLADADNPMDDSFSKKQLDLFERAVSMVREAGFDPKWIHAGQSAGSLKQSRDWINMVRMGLALYGVCPFGETDLKPVMRLESTVVGVRRLKVGDKVSYGCTFTAEKDMTIAMVPVGYYEALPLSVSDKGKIEVKGVMCPIVGRVCMNYTVVDVSDVSDVKIGDSVMVYSDDSSKENSITNMAKLVETIPYELMVRVAGSVRRVVA